MIHTTSQGYLTIDNHDKNTIVNIVLPNVMILNYYYYYRCVHLFKTSIVYFRCNSHNAVNTAQIMLITHCSNHEYTQS